MKIILIEPRQTIANVYSRLRMPLLGPLYLGTILRNRGHQVEIYNENFFQPDYSRLDADVIGISILTPTAKRGYEIARKFPREKVIIGGVHASLLPEEALAFSRQVVTGEAEEVIADVVEGRLTGAIVHGRPVEDLDTLPIPDFSLIKGLRSMVVQPVSTSRGCPFDCSFCSVTRVFGRKYRSRSPRSIVKELDSALSREVFFCDDNFCADRGRVKELALLMREAKRKFSWTCQARCDAAQDESLLRAMRDAGCSVVCVGMESVNERTLKSYDKRQNVQDIISAVRSFHRHRIKVHGMFVVGAEHDDAYTAGETFDFSQRYGLDTIQISILTPFPGTRVHEELSGEGRIFSRDWDLYDGQHAVFTPRKISPRELQTSVFRAYSDFYSLANSFFLLCKLRLRNGVLRLMGYSILREWNAANRGLAWLPHMPESRPEVGKE